MEPATTSALITGAASLIGTGASAVSQGKLNKKNRKWQEQMYERQRKDRLSDWELQNAYNSPAAQMQRLQEAGLNPNLVYGKGADNTAAPISEANIGSPQTKGLDFTGLGIGARDSLQAYNNFRLGSAQIDNLETRNTVNVQEAALKMAQRTESGLRAAKTDFELGMQQEMKETSLQLQRETLRKLLADTRFTLDQNERAAATTASSLQEAAQRILKMREETANTVQQRDAIRQQMQKVSQDIEIGKLDMQLAKDGIRRTDPFYYSILGRILGTDPVKAVKKELWDNPTKVLKSIPGHVRAKVSPRGATGSY